MEGMRATRMTMLLRRMPMMMVVDDDVSMEVYAGGPISSNRLEEISSTITMETKNLPDG